MPITTAHLTISLDGFLAGPDQTEEVPLGTGGEDLHRWMFTDDPAPANTAMREDLRRQKGAFVMGRNMFGPVRGAWDREWRGWWGEEPPYHAPVYVLTHHAHEPIPMKGGTTFHFVTDGFDAAYARAEAAAAELDVAIAGGASTVRQAFAANVLDELVLDIAPVLLHRGERIFDETTPSSTTWEPIEAHATPLATHVRYRLAPDRDVPGRADEAV